MDLQGFDCRRRNDMIENKIDVKLNGDLNIE